MVQVTLQLPEELVRDANEFGLLEHSTLVQLLQEELERRVNDLVNEEIHAYRAEKHADQKPSKQ